MEHYAQLFIATADTAAVQAWLNEQADESDLSLEAITVHAGMVVVALTGDSTTPEQVALLMQALQQQGANLVKGWITGDEDPWCQLLTATETGVDSETLESALFEHLAECDEDDIAHSKGLLLAYHKGPSAYFTNLFTTWRQGLEAQDLSVVQQHIDNVIADAENFF